LSYWGLLQKLSEVLGIGVYLGEVMGINIELGEVLGIIV
jgi:hypothetical protein